VHRDSLVKADNRFSSKSVMSLTATYQSDTKQTINYHNETIDSCKLKITK